MQTAGIGKQPLSTEQPTQSPSPQIKQETAPTPKGGKKTPAPGSMEAVIKQESSDSNPLSCGFSSKPDNMGKGGGTGTVVIKKEPDDKLEIKTEPGQSSNDVQQKQPVKTEQTKAPRSKKSKLV